MKKRLAAFFFKKELMSFKNYWQISQSPFGYTGEDEKLFNQWLLNKKK